MTEIFVNSDNVKLWTASQGSGFPLVLCNGGPGCCDYLAPVATIFEPTMQTIRFEQRGCGRSQSAPPYTIENCLLDLENIREAYGLERWIVAGHSWGADLALLYTLHYPERVLGLLAIAGGRINNDREWHRVYEQKRDQGLEIPLAFEYPPNMEVNAQLNQARKEYIQRPTLLKELSQLDVPSLFIYGSEDIRPSWPVEQVAQLLPKARFELIAGADHHIWLTHYDEMKRIALDFVNQVLKHDKSGD